jgi:hypothetical protein
MKKQATIPLPPEAREAVEAFIYIASLPKAERAKLFKHLDNLPVTISASIAPYPFFPEGLNGAASQQHLDALRGIAGPVERNFLNDSRLN